MRATSTRNRILFPLILVALVPSIAELGAYLLVSFERRAPFSWAENQAARAKIIAENEREEASGHAVLHPVEPTAKALEGHVGVFARLPP